MLDTTLTPGRVGLQNFGTSYAAQDFESLPVGNAVPFSSSMQVGQVIFGFDVLFADVTTFNDFASQDFESLPVGPISVIPVLPTATPFLPPVAFETGNITSQIFEYISDDLELYPQGPISVLNLTFQGGGDVFAKVGTLYPHFGGFL